MHRSLLAAWNSISLRTKITGVTVLVLTFGLLLTGIGTTLLFKPVLISQLDQQLEASSTSSSINAMLDSESTGNDQVSPDGESSAYFLAIYDSSGKLLGYNWRTKSSDLRPSVGTTLPADLKAACRAGDNFYLASNDGTVQYRARCVSISYASDNQAGSAIVATSTNSIDVLMAAYLTIFLGFGVIVVVVGAVLTRMLVTTTFAPLRQVERTAAAIADGDFSQRLGGAEPNTEVGRLNRSLNTMLSRIDRAFKDRARTIEQMRRFVGDASHELRTPLVSVRGYAELYRMGALQDEAAVAGAMGRIEKEALRMGGLVEDLLELARLDETRPLQLAQVDLLPLAYDAAMDARAAHPTRHFGVVVDLPPAAPPAPGPSASDDPTPTQVIPVVGARVPPAATGLTRVAQRGGIRRTSPAQRAGADSPTGPIGFTASALARLRRRGPVRRTDDISMAETMPLELEDIPEPHTVPALVLGEENKLRQVLGNLIGNAVRYTPDGSPIEVRVTADLATRRACVEVVDHGEGIPPQIREKIFERFWRADTSRTRETGGSGLGLAIVTSIIHAHKGSVAVVETPGGGATFRVLLPLSDAAL
ncbi:sensor histidine kinase [Gryllotalpicola protaetiae]|uniref:histidine kinase n=1 Tax=Gryllotalpicola protaetiae TaxID=2419771 RepID=A0A387BPB6_9MICO|nr:ATP-binding protein [Gryllotalpicola protaetiae]AYG02796.1 HAMP domain-containing protein [Gryllotalpicola protaetiae]